MNIPSFNTTLNTTALPETDQNQVPDVSFEATNQTDEGENQQHHASDVFFDARNQTGEGRQQLNQVSDVSFVATNQTDLEGKFSKSKKICAVIKTYMLNNK